MTQDCVVGVSGHEENRQTGVMKACLLGHLTPIQPRHDHVGDEQLNPVYGLSAESKGFLPVLRFQNGEAYLSQEGPCYFATLLFILHQKDDFAPASISHSRRHGSIGRLVQPLKVREVEFEGRANPRFTVEPDVALALLHDTEDSG